MASTFTANAALEKPARGDDVGTWDTPVNGNQNIIDSKFGTCQSISLAAGSVTLSTAQAQSAFLNFNGALPGSVTVTIPGLSTAPGTTVSGAFYTVQNQTSNSSTRTVTLASTVAGQEVIAIPPYEAVDVLIEGSGSSQAGSIKFRNLGRVGTYWDYAGSSVPNWVSACTKPPYLNCDGSAFSAVTYPALAMVLAGTTLPDSRGRYRATLNQTTGRITAGSGGVDGDTILAGGGTQTVTLSSANIPQLTQSHHHSARNVLVNGGAPATVDVLVTDPGNIGTEQTGDTTISVGNPANTAFGMLPPSYVGGLTLIRAA